MEKYSSSKVITTGILGVVAGIIVLFVAEFILLIVCGFILEYLPFIFSGLISVNGPSAATVANNVVCIGAGIASLLVTSVIAKSNRPKNKAVMVMSAILILVFIIDAVSEIVMNGFSLSVFDNSALALVGIVGAVSD